MLSSLLAALGVFAPQTLSPVERYEAFMAQNPSFEVGLTVTFTGSPLAAKGTYARRLPQGQSFRIRWGGQDFEFRQNAAGVLAVMHSDRLYGEYPPFPMLVPPPREVSGLADLAFPEFFAVTRMDRMFDGVEWKPAGQAEIGGVTVDLLRAETETDVVSTYEAAIDPIGRLVRMRAEDKSDMVSQAREWTMSGFVTTPLPDERFTSDLPWGYMPYEPPDNSRPVLVGSKAPFQPARDVRTGERVDLAEEYEREWVAVLFTTPDCLVSEAQEPAWRSLREALAKHDCALIEVSLGSEPPKLEGRDTERRLFQDVDAGNQRAFGLPGTPYVMVVAPDGRVGRAWWGLADDTRAKMVRTLLEPFTKKPD